MPIAFRSRAPGTATHVEHQAHALLSEKVSWRWVVIATEQIVEELPFLREFKPIIVSKKPLSYHVCFRLGRLFARHKCDLGMATSFFAPLFGPPVITNYFDANAFHSVDDHRNTRQRLKSAVIKKLWALGRKRSRALFILSDFGRAEMIKHEPSTAAKWVVTPCGCPPLAPVPVDAPDWARPCLGKKFVLFAGAFSENKNQRRLIAAWNELRISRSEDLPLVLLGPCPQDYFDQVIRPAIATTAFPHEVIAPGFVTAEELAWAFNHAYAYVQPSFAEGFGIPVVEAMSCGVPVACSRSTSLPEVAGEAAIYFNPGEIESIKSALAHLISNPLERSRLVLMGRERAKHFTWEKNARIVRATIEQQLTQQ